MSHLFAASFYICFYMNEEKKYIEKKKKRMSDKTKQLIRIIVAVVFLFLSVYYTVKDIDFAKLWQYIINADYLWVLLSVPVMILSHG